MSNIEFDEENIGNNHFKSSVVFGESKTPAMVRGLIKLGIVKNEKTAGYLLFVIAGICFLLSAYIFAVYVFGVRFGTPKTPPQRPIDFLNGRMVPPNVQNTNIQQ